jgi:myo-inositol-1(or 4)-monophosphatase
MSEILHPALLAAADAAGAALHQARARYTSAELGEHVAVGADATPTSRLDVVVEAAICSAIERFRINVLSEELGSIDVGSAVTLVLDPVDGTANAVAGVPVCGFAGAIAVDGVFEQALTEHLDTGRRWAAVRGADAGYRTSGRRDLRGASVSLLRPDRRNRAAWNRIADQVERIRVLSCSTIEAALVAQGSTDAFADAGSDRHRLCDLAAAVVMLESAGGAVRDVYGRPIVLDVDLTRRWSGVVAASPELADELVATILDEASMTA